MNLIKLLIQILKKLEIVQKVLEEPLKNLTEYFFAILQIRLSFFKEVVQTMGFKLKFKHLFILCSIKL